MPRIKLTQHAIDKTLRAPHPSGRQMAYWDQALPGFGVVVSGISRTKSYVVQRDLPGGRTRRVTIANVGELKLDDARERGKRMLLDMREGIDPKQQRSTGMTLRQTLNNYLAKNSGLAPRSQKQYTHLITRHLEPWCDRPLSGITPDEVDAMHAKLGRRSGLTVANDVMRCLRMLWNWAASRDDNMPRNPVRLRKDEWHSVAPRRRPIPAEQLAAWYAAVQQLPPNGRDWLTLMLFTGLRRREADRLRWDENIDLNNRTIRLSAESVKGKRALDLPMTDVIYDLLVARRALGNAVYVFPSYGRSGHVDDPRGFLTTVQAATGIEFSSHDLRRTFLTVAESCDISVYALKALVNHSIGSGVTEGYINMTVDRLREPAQRVCDKLKALCGIAAPQGANVAKLHA